MRNVFGREAGRILFLSSCEFLVDMMVVLPAISFVCAGCGVECVWSEGWADFGTASLCVCLTWLVMLSAGSFVCVGRVAESAWSEGWAGFLLLHSCAFS